MIKLNYDEKRFLKDSKEKIIKEDWASFIDSLYGYFMYAAYPDLNPNKILNLLKEIGVNYERYPKFKLGEAVKINDVGEIVDEDLIFPIYLKKYKDANFVFVSDVYGVVEDIIPYFSGIINFVYIVRITETEKANDYALINQRGLKKI